MGKTVLAQQLAHHRRVWQAFPGGVLWVTAGEEADAVSILGRLERMPGIGTLEDLAGAPVLVIVDDVWAEELLRSVRDALPDTVTVLATTRGVHVDGIVPVRVDKMAVSEAVVLLAQDTARTPAVQVALASLAAVLAYWPLLLDLAARHLHLTGLDLTVVDDPLVAEPVELEGESQGLGPDELVDGAQELQAAVAADPTVLDDPASRQRSLTRMVERSLAVLGDNDQQGFAELAAFPPDVDLTKTLLGDLWALDPVRTQQRMTRLGRVGLASLRPRPLALHLHDLIVAWLHQRHGLPGAPAQQPLHRRCARAAMDPAGGPGQLTGDRAGWLAFHLCRTGQVSDPAILLHITWRAAYRDATGSDASYLEALRTIVRHYGALPDDLGSGSPDPVQLEAWMLRGVLLHAYVSGQVGATPVSALVALALLGQPSAALRQAAHHPQPQTAAQAIVNILAALRQHHRLPREVIKLAADLAETLSEDAARSRAFAGTAEVLAAHDPERAAQLLYRAQQIAEALPDEERRGAALAEVARVLAPIDPERAQQVAEAIPEGWERHWTLVVVARAVGRALAALDPERARQIAEALPDEERRSAALAAVAEALAPRDPERAQQVAEAIPDKERRSETLAGVAEALTPHDPERAGELLYHAQRVAEAIFEEWERSSALAAVAKVLALLDPKRATELFYRAQEAAEALPDKPGCRPAGGARSRVKIAVVAR
jgi:hypothetical protein